MLLKKGIENKPLVVSTRVNATPYSVAFTLTKPSFLIKMALMLHLLQVFHLNLKG